MRICKFQCLMACLFIVCSLPINAQVYDFGDIPSKQKFLKEIPFDLEADAVVLFDVAVASYNDNYNLLVERRTRIKILKEKGVRHGNVEIPFYSKDNFEVVTNLEAAVYSIDENGNTVIMQLKHSDVFRQKLNDRLSLVKFALPNVKVGSIIEYKYVSNYKHYGGLQDWFFQREIPTLYSNFLLVIPPRQEFTYNVHKSTDLPIEIINDKNSGSVKFAMQNIAGLRDEPYMDAEKDYLQHVEFQFSGYMNQTGSKIAYMNKWSEVSRELMGEPTYGKQLGKTLPNSEAIIAGFKLLEDEDQRVKNIYNYVRQKFTWNGLYTKYVEDGVKEVWVSGKGSSAEINFLLINLLRSCGIVAHPMLVNERRFGRITTEIPIIDQFHSTIAYVVTSKQTYVLDGTDAITPFGLIPESLLNTKAYIVDNKKGGLSTLEDKSRLNSNVVNLFSIVDETGQLKGEVSIVSADYSKIKRQKTYKNNKEAFTKEYLLKGSTGIAIDSLMLIDIDKDSLPLQQNFKYKMNAATAGNYKVLNLNMFSGFETNPFIGENRFSNVNFGYRLNTSLVQQYQLPKNLKVEDLPKNVLIKSPDESLIMTRTISLSDNYLMVKILLKIDRPVFTPDEYPMLKEFYKQMFSYLEEPVLLIAK